MTSTTRQVFSISLPLEMAREVEQVSDYEQRTASELVREALRNYLKNHKERIPVARATPQELRAIRMGERQIREGKFRSLSEILHEMES